MIELRRVSEARYLHERAVTADVQRLLPQLATYPGHVHIAATQRYLTMTPELLRQASVRFERYARGGDDHA